MREVRERNEFVIFLKHDILEITLLNLTLLHKEYISERLG